MPSKYSTQQQKQQQEAKCINVKPLFRRQTNISGMQSIGFLVARNYRPLSDSDCRNSAEQHALGGMTNEVRRQMKCTRIANKVQRAQTLQ
jgi:hypothetical protein